jgi:hypothetical protein
MDKAPNVTQTPPTGEPAAQRPVKPGPASHKVSVQFGPTPSPPGSRLKGRGK